MNNKIAIDGYELLDELGQGGFGCVFRAQQLSTGQVVAIKILNNRVNGSPEIERMTERFERETHLCAQLNHPNIVRLLDKGKTREGQLFAVFEMVPGETLKHHLSRVGTLPSAEAGELMGQVLDALACAHSHGVVHRDIKPQNIMICNTFARLHAKVLDFGVGAFIPEVQQTNYKNLTLTNEAVGTPSYSAPEQLRGEPPTTKSDIYAWGLVFIECLTGKPVMQGTTLAEVYHKQLSPIEVPLPPAVAAHPVGNLLRRALQKKPVDRSEKASQLYRDFKALNLAEIVGDISPSITTDSFTTGIGETQESLADLQMARAERRQITVLCFSLYLSLDSTEEPDPEMLDTLQRDQLSQCIDTAQRYGGHHAGSLGDSAMLFFGYPYISDNDARRAARTALEITVDAQRRATLLKKRYGALMALRVGLHPGTVLAQQDQMPMGIALDIALRLTYQAEPGKILVSETTRKLLEPYVNFDNCAEYPIGGSAKGIKTYWLVSERRSEAYSFGSISQTGKPMVGRREQLDRMLLLWKQIEKQIEKQAEQPIEQQTENKIQQQNHNAVLVVGEPGIGKSRLMYELRGNILEYGGMVCDCRCLPEHKNRALFPILEMLKQQLGLGDITDLHETAKKIEIALEPCAVDVPTALPILCSWFSLPIPAGYQASQLTPQRQKQELLESLQQLIFHLNPCKPILLVIEDLHWVDPTTQDFLNGFIKALSTLPILLIMTTRPVDLERWQDLPLTIENLDNLSSDEVEALVKQLLKGKSLHKNIVTTLIERTDGIPLFVEEFTGMLLDRELIVHRNGVYTLDSTYDTAEIPLTLRDSLSERLQHLGAVKETAQLAATIGRHFDYELLARTSSYEETVVLSHLQRLLTANLIYRQRRAQGDLYVFRHALIRDAAYESMLKSIRERNHETIATSIEEYFPAIARQEPAEVARHYAEGKQYSKAVQFGLLAVRESAARSANEETTVLAEQVLSWNAQREISTDQMVAENDVCQLMLPAVMAMKGLGADELVQLSQRILELHKSLKLEGDDSEFLCQWILFIDHQFHSRCKAAIALGEKIIKEAQNIDNRVQEMLVLPLLGQTYHLAGNLIDGRERCERALKLYDETQDQALWLEFGVEPKSQALFLLSHILCCQGYPDQAVEKNRESVMWAKKTGCSMFVDGAYLFSSMVAYLRKEPDQIIRLYNDHRQYYQGELPEGQWLVDYCKMSYDWAENSLVHHSQFVDTLLSLGRSGALCWWEAKLAETLMSEFHQDVETAIERLQNTINRCVNDEEIGAIPILKRTLARAYYLRDGLLTNEIEALFKQAVKSAQEQGADWLELDARYYYASIVHGSGNAEYAISIISPILPTLTEGKSTPLYQQALKLSQKI